MRYKEMCGIVAILAQRSNPLVLKCLVEGIKMLQNRGYDSCGGSLLGPDRAFWTWKGASDMAESAIQKLDARLERVALNCWSAGCFQTRWATHGAKTDQNAHPHSDQSGRFHLVHNGIITNYAVLKERLVQKGYVFRSETDTEVVVHLVADCLKSAAEGSDDMLGIWQSVVRHLEGTWSLIMTDRENPGVLYVAKNGSPLLMSQSEDGQMVCLSSELYGIRFRTKQYEEIPDGAVFSVSVTDLGDSGDSGNSGTFDISGLEKAMDTGCRVETFDHAVTPAPYTFWTELEINQQKQSLWDALNHGGRLYVSDFGEQPDWHVKLGGLESKRHEFSSVRHLVLTGCGTSLHAALFAARVFRAISGFVTVQVFDASELSADDLVFGSDAEDSVAVVFVSQSGETKDCIRAFEQLVRPSGFLTVGVVNAVGSWLARHTDCGVYLNAGREVGVASTKSFTSQCMVLTLMAMWFSSRKASMAEWGPRVYNLPDRLARCMDALELSASSLSPSLSAQRCLFILGRGYSHPVALEAALKLKELTYQNVEGYPGGALKHGPFAVLDAGCTVFLHAWSGPNCDTMLSAAEQVTSRQARVVLLFNRPDDEKSLQRRFPGSTLVCVPLEDDWSVSLVSVVFYQFLAFYLARYKGFNPDYPRNLAKVVTVDG